ncbi:MAG TPA: trigger factor [Clostridiales bacterium]|nr:trigger factor [Clostridiales bacterium]
MNKNKVILIMCVCMLLILTGCNKKNSKNYKLKDHVKLGQYKGIEVKVQKIDVTDNDVKGTIKSELLSKFVTEKEVTDRTIVKLNDLVDIDFEGRLDDIPFDNGKGENFPLEIGSQQFIEGFEEQLIGAEVGQTVNLNVKFPEEYFSAELAGKDVVFIVKVNSIISEMSYPELNDEFIKENTEFETAEAYIKSIKEKLETSKEEYIKNAKTNEVFNAIVENAEIISFPQSAIDKYLTEMDKYYSKYAEEANLELSEFINQQLGISEEEYRIQSRAMAEETVGQQLIIEAIVEAEKIKVTKKELNDEINKYLENYSIESREMLFSQISEEQIKDNILWKKALDFVIDNAKEI